MTLTCLGRGCRSRRSSGTQLASMPSTVRLSRWVAKVLKKVMRAAAFCGAYADARVMSSPLKYMRAVMSLPSGDLYTDAFQCA